MKENVVKITCWLNSFFQSFYYSVDSEYRYPEVDKMPKTHIMPYFQVEMRKIRREKEKKKEN